MAAEPVKIPQNVYVEDRIVGPLTLKQTLIMTVGGGISYMIFAMLQKTMNGNPGMVYSIIAWIPCAISVLFALVKINDLSLMRIVFLTIERMYKSPVRTFAPRAGIAINVRFSNTKPEDPKTLRTRAEDERAVHRIRELSSIIDRPLDTAQEEPTAPSATEPPIDPAIEVPSSAPLDGIAPAAPTTPAAASAPQTRTPAAAQTPTLPGASFSDLSVFRDVFLPKQKP